MLVQPVGVLGAAEARTGRLISRLLLRHGLLDLVLDALLGEVARRGLGGVPLATHLLVRSAVQPTRGVRVLLHLGRELLLVLAPGASVEQGRLSCSSVVHPCGVRVSHAALGPAGGLQIRLNVAPA